MSELTSGIFPGQRITVGTDASRKLLSVGFHDQAIRGEMPFVAIQFNRQNAVALITNLLETYEDLYGEPFKRREPLDDTQRI